MSNEIEKSRVTVANAIEAARTIISGHDESLYPSILNVYTNDAHDGAGPGSASDGRKYRVELVNGKNKALEKVRASFLRFCVQTGTKPRNMYDVWDEDSYTGAAHIEDFEHDISDGEMAAWIARFKQKDFLPSEQKIHSVVTDETWIVKARRLACDVFEEAEKAMYGTDQKSVSKKVAALCAKQGIRTDKDKPLSASYILRHSLSPWDIPKIVLANRQK